MNRSQFFYVLFSVVCIQACTQDNSSKSLEKPNPQVSAPPAEIAVTPEVAAVPETTIFNMADWVITNKSLGPISIGSTLESNQVHLSNFEKKKVPAYKLGVDGEGAMEVYYFEGKMAFHLTEYKNKISSIYILNQAFKSANGIGLGSTAGEIIKACPDIEFTMNLMSGGDFADSKKCGYFFEFDESVCDYNNGEMEPGIPVRKNLKPVRMRIQ